MRDRLFSELLHTYFSGLHGSESFVLQAHHSFATVALAHSPSAVDLQRPKNAEIKARSDH
jgi:hypothetical protein